LPNAAVITIFKAFSCDVTVCNCI